MRYPEGGQRADTGSVTEAQLNVRQPSQPRAPRARVETLLDPDTALMVHSVTGPLSLGTILRIAERHHGRGERGVVWDLRASTLQVSMWEIANLDPAEVEVAVSRSRGMPVAWVTPSSLEDAIIKIMRLEQNWGQPWEVFTGFKPAVYWARNYQR